VTACKVKRWDSEARYVVTLEPKKLGLYGGFGGLFVCDAAPKSTIRALCTFVKWGKKLDVEVNCF